ncbi:MAG: hypothetical protein M3Z08_11010 [Chloroflexota bacterium]|nr:hypothetical protein [Chloroflexota bacterium]
MIKQITTRAMTAMYLATLRGTTVRTAIMHMAALSYMETRGYLTGMSSTMTIPTLETSQPTKGMAATDMEEAATANTTDTSQDLYGSAKDSYFLGCY